MPIDPQYGYVRPDFQDILNKVKSMYIKQFGSDIDLSDTSILGGFANINAQIIDDFEATSQANYAARHTLTSTGTELDDDGADENVFRKPATNSYVELQIQGYVDDDSQTVITTDEGEFSTADGHIFQILSDVTISEPAKKDDGSTLTDEDGNVLGQVNVQAISEETGADNNVMANTIITPEESVDGFYSVTNPQAAVGGADTESDDSLRKRILSNRISKPNNTLNGITTAIKNIDSVKDARLIDNNEMTADKYGNPPLTAHLYVVGGNDDEVAQTYFQHLPPLEKTVGSISKDVIDVGNKKHTIYFDNANNVPIFLSITISTDVNNFDTDSGENNIKNNIINYFNSFNMGDSVNFTKLYGPIYSVKGVTSVDIKLGKSTSDLKENTNINVDNFDLPVVTADNIQIINNKVGE